jgi:epsilon-lactone hydrolase
VSQARFLRHLAKQSPGVLLSRFRKGPARESWSFGFELFTTALRHTTFDLATLDWPDLRASFDDLAKSQSRALLRVKRQSARVGGVEATWFFPRRLGQDRPTTVLYLHGGGYVFGSSRSHRVLIARLALASPARVLAPDYRLAPENPYPAALEDAVAVYRGLLDQGVDPARLVVGGDSAGGGLTLALLLRLRVEGVPLPAGAILLCPWVDLTAQGGSLAENASFDWGNEEIGRRWIRAYLGDRDPTDPFVSPVFADLRGLPPLLVQVGAAELLRDQVATFVERACAAGVDVRATVEPDMVHDWQTFASFFPTCARPIHEAGAFVREVVG